MPKGKLGVLVIHGFTSSLDCVSGVEDAIRELGLPTRMPVLRGHSADSPLALKGVTWQDWVSDARAALQDLLTEVEKAVVFGHSMGGLVTLALAADGGGMIDSIVVAAAAIQINSIFAPGRPLSFLAPIVTRVLTRIDMPPVYADPELAAHDTNYRWAPTDAVAALFDFSRAMRARLPDVYVPALIMHSRRDSAISPESAEIIYRRIATPPAEKKIVWFYETEHEMFRDLEREATIRTVVDYVRERTASAGAPAPSPSPARAQDV
jgi:carboxylesterase